MQTIYRPDLSAFVARLSLRSALSAEERAAILGLPGRTSTVAARHDIVTPGTTVDYACLVVNGLLGRFDQMRDGGRQTTAFHIPGDMCDLQSVASPNTGWGIAALEPSTILQVPHAALRSVAQAYPGIAMAFWRDTVVDASVLSKWVANVGRKDARARIAHLLCEMGVRMERAGLGTRTAFRFGATQEQIADAVGLTAMHVNRTLGTLRSDGAVTLHDGQVAIADWDRLASIAEFEPAFLLLPQQH